MSRVAILSYNAGNTMSVESALARLGANVVISRDREEILSADRIVFPGVGHARAAIESLRESGLDQVLQQARQPVLGICLGMQLLCSYCEEGQVDGLGIYKIECCKFSDSQVKIPHVGWNTANFRENPLFSGINQESFFYFVHSYRVPVCDQTAAVCRYGADFSAALWQDNFYGVQFHPEKSAANGQRVLENFLQLQA